MAKKFTPEQADKIIQERIERAWRIVEEDLEQTAAERGLSVDEMRAKLEELKGADPDTDITELVATDKEVGDLKKQVELKEDKKRLVNEHWYEEHQKMTTRNALQDIYEEWGGRPGSFNFAIEAIRREAGNNNLEFGMKDDQLVIKNSLNGEVLPDKNVENVVKDFLRERDYFVIPSFDKTMLVTSMPDYIKARFDALDHGLKMRKYKDTSDPAYKQELNETIDMMNNYSEEVDRQQAEGAKTRKEAFEKLNAGEREKALSGETPIKGEKLQPGESAEEYAKRLGFWADDQNVAKPAWKK